MSEFLEFAIKQEVDAIESGGRIQSKLLTRTKGGKTYTVNLEIVSFALYLTELMESMGSKSAEKHKQDLLNLISKNKTVEEACIVMYGKANILMKEGEDISFAEDGVIVFKTISKHGDDTIEALILKRRDEEIGDIIRDSHFKDNPDNEALVFGEEENMKILSCVREALAQ